MKQKFSHETQKIMCQAMSYSLEEYSDLHAQFFRRFTLDELSFLLTEYRHADYVRRIDEKPVEWYENKRRATEEVEKDSEKSRQHMQASFSSQRHENRLKKWGPTKQIKVSKTDEFLFVNSSEVNVSGNFVNIINIKNLPDRYEELARRSMMGDKDAQQIMMHTIFAKVRNWARNIACVVAKDQGLRSNFISRNDGSGLADVQFVTTNLVDRLRRYPALKPQYKNKSFDSIDVDVIEITFDNF